MKFNINTLKKEILDREFGFLNAMQRAAVYKSTGPVLVLAGAGSGKTTALVSKIVYLVNYGDSYNSEITREYSASEQEFLFEYAKNPTPENRDMAAELIAVRPVSPWNILAITFTNKAANELKERIIKSLGEKGEDVLASTFHSACTRILRRDGDKIGLERSFTIYDSDDQKRLIKSCVKALGLAEKNFPPNAVLSVIGRAKDSLLPPAAFALQATDDYRMAQIAKIYEMYQNKMQQASALDFDDIIFKTVTLLSDCPDVLSHYQNKFKNIVV
ncbi:MAG: UvrD-helicase domain-containing protein, partial [Ruthenibacterium sp.]